MTETKSLCQEIQRGSVGESGTSSMSVHHVTAEIDKLMVLRSVQSSLCPNTGAVGVLLVNGMPEATGKLTAVGSSIQAGVRPGDAVVSVVHTYPLFNNIMCVRLGNLYFTIDECDLEAITLGLAASGYGMEVDQASCRELKGKDWSAWNSKFPPKPDDFHVTGQVQVPNPGIDVALIERDPQGINKYVLLMDLVATQRPGKWLQQQVWKSVQYDKIMSDACYTSVEIFCGGEKFEDVPVVTSE